MDFQVHLLDGNTKSALDEAQEVVNGDRQKYYGHPLDNHGNTAEFWTSYLARKHGIRIKLAAEDVCWMMVLLKISRECNLVKRDNIVDALGYIANIEMIQKERNRRIPPPRQEFYADAERAGLNQPRDY